MKKATIKSMYQVLAIIFLIGMIFSTAYFFIGFHNLDLGHNMMTLELTFNTTLTDYNGYQTVTGEQAYINGIHQMIISFFVMLISAINFSNFKRYL